MNWLGQLLLLGIREQNRCRYRLKLRRWKAEDYEIAYLCSSGRNTGPTLVFLHGLGASKDQWGPQIYSMVDTYNCIFVDLPGEGESSFDKSQSYSPATQAWRLKAFLDTQLSKSFVLIGSSIGGCIACIYAAAFPADVSHLIAMAPAGLPALRPSLVMKQFLESDKHPFGYRTVDEMQNFWSIAFHRAPRIPLFLAKALAIKGALRYTNVVKILEDFKDAGLYPLETLLTQIQALTLIVWGSEDCIFDISCLDKIISDLPKASICIIEGAGHVPYLECSEQTVTAIRQFIAE
ncbi:MULTISPECIES: alpha/beta fold hydrolase [Pseudomonas]|uniref:alpha/beta fold hydrolase n=1 Tax=Pseudomonas TaxID=286 RepID=UPI0007AEC548|nr:MULTISPECIES: alpha/beta hydrolase [Pseudomonas]KZL42396.1 alpha/beta hydrolase [Pseudomonas syringae pv. syringae]MBP1119553.1 pimeloyl-ACP methyl ester carboxylesterase [Pseudomonas sp. PvP028]SFH69362.1 Pimeloyl-ACP methyl ester carboxylesterase [Pseudomonas syringae]